MPMPAAGQHDRGRAAGLLGVDEPGEQAGRDRGGEDLGVAADDDGRRPGAVTRRSRAGSCQMWCAPSGGASGEPESPVAAASASA